MFGLNRVSLLVLTTAFLSVNSAAQVCAGGVLSGNVFYDFNGNGSQDALELGVANVQVEIVSNTEEQVSVVTDNQGKFSASSLPNGNSYRVEFKSYAEHLAPGPIGSGSASNVVFLELGSNCEVNLALTDGKKFCEQDPEIAVPCYVAGNPLGSGDAASGDVLVSFPSSRSGRISDADYQMPNHKAFNNEIGTTWGLAYQRSTKTIFAAAALKRHAGFGPTGTGGIYRIDTANNVITEFIDFNNFFSAGADPRTTPLPDSKLALSYDGEPYPLIGKIAFGGMDISKDEKSLFVVNLNDKTLYKIFINSPAVEPQASDFTAYPIPNPGCSDGSYRPWAVTVHQNKAHVGVVCSAENSKNDDELHAFVLRLEDDGTYSEVYNRPLNYDKGYAIVPPFNPFPDAGTKFHHWIDDYNEVLNGQTPTGNYTITPNQPILSSIAFDDDGSMILGILDRAGFQFGPLQLPILPPFYLINAPSGGDTLRACLIDGQYVDEGDPACMTATGAANPSKLYLPEPAEYYHADRFRTFVGTFQSLVINDDVDVHQETSMGAVAVIPGTGKVLNAVYDGFEVEDGSIATFDNKTGDRDQAYQLYVAAQGSGTFGKAVGLGDLEPMCAMAPVEIGNRVWFDSDKDGIQDAGEAPISGVTVNLYKAGGELLDTTITDNNGEYYFKLLSADSNGIVSEEQIALIGTELTICLDNQADTGNNGALAGLDISTANAGNNAELDSNGINVNGFSCATVIVGAPGENDYSIDFGFSSEPEQPQCNFESLTATNLTIDGNSLQLYHLAKQAFGKKKGIKECSKLSSVVDEILEESWQFHLDVWQAIWSFGESHFNCQGDIIPQNCILQDKTSDIISMQSKTKAMNKLVRKATREAKKCANPISKKDRRTLRKEARKVKQISIDLMQSSLPKQLVSCN